MFKAIITTLNDLIFVLQIVPTKLCLDIIPERPDLIIKREFKYILKIYMISCCYETKHEIKTLNKSVQL